MRAGLLCLAAAAAGGAAVAAAIFVDVFPQPVLVVPQFVAIRRHLLPLGLRSGTVLLILLPVLLELLHVLLQLRRVARGHVGLNLLPIAQKLLACLTLLVLVVAQGLTSLGEIAFILLDLLVSLLNGGT